MATPGHWNGSSAFVVNLKNVPVQGASIPLAHAQTPEAPPDPTLEAAPPPVLASVLLASVPPPAWLVFVPPPAPGSESSTPKNAWHETHASTASTPTAPRRDVARVTALIVGASALECQCLAMKSCAEALRTSAHLPAAGY